MCLSMAASQHWIEQGSPHSNPGSFRHSGWELCISETHMLLGASLLQLLHLEDVKFLPLTFSNIQSNNNQANKQNTMHDKRYYSE